jgi:succinyl-diaminopimelate desuccinylase
MGEIKMIDFHSDFIKDLSGLLAIPSLKDTTEVSESKPFGKAVNDALLYMLNLGEKAGFRTINHNGYYGYIEYGPEEAEDYIAVLCHVDVVPATGTWSSDPFTPTIVGDKIVARGASDDKGPTMAAFYALKQLKESETSPTHRIRLIIGTDEESGMRCMQKYVETEPPALFGFAPDARFPVIHAEKGQISLTLKIEDTTDTSSNFTLLSFVSGERGNMVPDHCVCTFRGCEMNRWIDVIQQEANLLSIPYTLSNEDDVWTLTVTGKSAHGAEPFKGENAAFSAASLLHKLPFSGSQSTYIRFIHSVLLNNHYGEQLSIEHSDEITGPLTVNAGIFIFKALEGGEIFLNVRCPVTTSYETTKTNVEKVALSHGLQMEVIKERNPHYVSGDHPGVQALVQAYEEETGLEGTLLSTGGATYARYLDSGVAFGALFPNKISTAHQIDEYAEIEDLHKAIDIYRNALSKLVHLEK